METTYIYTLTDPETNMVRYVGKANNIKQRYSAHLNRARKHQIHKKNWIASLRKKKLKPIIDIIDIVPIKDWTFWETYWISQFKTWGFDLINYTNGGEGCTFGNQTSFKKGEGAIPVLQIDTKGSIVKEFESQQIASKIFGKQIYRAIDKERKSVGGFLWLRKITYESFSEEDLKKFISSFVNRKRKPNVGNFKKGIIPWTKNNSGYKLGGKKKAIPVLQFDLENNFIKEHYSYNEAAKEINCLKENIRLACVGKIKSTKGFKWKYKTNN